MRTNTSSGQQLSVAVWEALCDGRSWRDVLDRLIHSNLERVNGVVPLADDRDEQKNGDEKGQRCREDGKKLLS